MNVSAINMDTCIFPLFSRDIHDLHAFIFWSEKQVFKMNKLIHCNLKLK